jgi:nucleotide-binding universal stress UspA family protein
MKKLLISTDFSAYAAHAASYGYALAKQIKADITLCNAFIVPAEIPQAGVVVWPMETYNMVLKSSADGLKQLKIDLESKYHSGYTPVVSLVNEMGTLTDVVKSLVDSHPIDLVVMGTHGSSGLSTVILGNHSKRMINESAKPLLLVPFTAPVKPVKKIAYATDFKHPEKDLLTIYRLIPFAKELDAEILLTHVLNGTHQSPTFKKWLDNMLTDVSNKADYPKIYYRLIKNSEPECGLDWLCEHGQVDILAMLHHKQGFLHNLLYGSHTQKMAEHITIPLLVFPEKWKEV